MGREPPQDTSHRLVLEGPDDLYVTEAILEKTGVSCSFTPNLKRSLGALMKSMSAEIKAPGREAVGFVLDANSDPEVRWKEVTESLRGVCDLPDEPDPAGAVVGACPRVGVWMMPDNGSAGEVEDFVTTMVPADDPVWPLAERFIARLPDAQREYTERKPNAAILHAWLATRRRAGRMAAAIRDGELDVKATLPTAYTAWLQRLFRS